MSEYLDGPELCSVCNSPDQCRCKSPEMSTAQREARMTDEDRKRREEWMRNDPCPTCGATITICEHTRIGRTK